MRGKLFHEIFANLFAEIHENEPPANSRCETNVEENSIEFYENGGRNKGWVSYADWQ